MKKAFTMLRKNKGKIKRRNIIFLLLLLAVNSYAWFSYIAKANISVETSIVSWDVEFFDENAEKLEVKIKIDNLYPGMDAYSKKIIIKNSSETSAKFSYEIRNLKILGKEYILDQNENLIDVLKDKFPYSIYFINEKDILDALGDTATFEVKADWNYEAGEEYFKVTKEFVYVDGTTYYKKNGNVYEADSSITRTNFMNAILDGIYVESDDADTYWGEQASLYKKNNPNLPSISFDLRLKVTQIGG